MALHHMLRAAVQQQAAGPSDPYFEYNTLLLSGDGTNGAQNNTFLDSSTNNFTITRNGNTTQGTFSPYGNVWSNYQPNSAGQGLTVPTNTALNLGTGDFTIEAWVNTAQLPTSNTWITSAGGYQAIFGTGPNNSGTGTQLYIGTTDILFDISSDGSGPISVAHGFVAGTWYHIALSRSGNTFRLFKDGVLLQSATSSSSWNNGYGFQIGGAEPVASGGFTGGWWYGYISNFRIVKGTALYTSNFTPSTTPLTAVSGTSLLTCQSNRFIDNSSNNFTLTVNGNTSVQRFSPFNPTATYSASTIGGSGYFDGSGDELRTPSITVGTQAFCYECWLYPTATQPGSPGGPCLFVGASNNALQLSYYGANLGLGIAQKKVAWQVNNSNGVVPTVGQWNHVAFVRSGTGTNQTSIFLNGVRIANGTVSYNYAASVYAFSIIDGDFGGYIGYMSGSRFILGSTPYDATQSTITIPTAPPTPITNTSLLLNFTNAGIPDASMQNDLETVGNAQVSTSVKKYGTGSLYFDGSGDYLAVPANTQSVMLGSGSFTIEFWLYPAASQTSTRTPIISFGNGFTTNVWAIQLNNTSPSYVNRIQLWAYNLNSGAVVAASTGTISASTWTHVALVRSGSAFTIYINGVADGTGTSSASIDGGSTTLQFQVGYNSPDYYNGYIDDLRITKGYARYTANFTPPTAALPVY